MKKLLAAFGAGLLFAGAAQAANDVSIPLNYSSCNASDFVVEEDSRPENTGYLSDQDAFKEAVFGTPGTELLGLNQFVNKIETEVQMPNFSEKAYQSISGQDVEFFEMDHWTGYGHVGKKVFLKLDEREDSYWLKIYEAETGKEREEKYSTYFIYTKGSVFRGSIQLNYVAKNKLHNVHVMIPVDLQTQYTWKMFEAKEPIPNFITPSINSIMMERNCTDWMWPSMMTGIKAQSNSISDYDLLNFMASAARSHREIAKAYMRNQRLVH